MLTEAEGGSSAVAGKPKCAYLYLEWLSGFVLGRLGQAIFRGGPYNAPASENQFSEAGKSAHHGK